MDEHKAIDPHWAWQTYVPSGKCPWDITKVGHLYRRAAFGANWSELQAGLNDGPDKTVDKLLAGGSGLETFDKQTAALARTITQANNGLQARAWWLYRMLYTPHLALEKMTLFWHNHFATSNAKVNNAGYMLGQYELLKRNALGNIRTLLQEISQDPAMMVWLDTALSKKGMPNENYARELMELFSLGIGHYTETDIREAARAFTGWEIREGRGYLDKSKHDDGEKTVLSRKGNWTGRDIVRICLDQECAPYFLAGKLFRFLISESITPTKELLKPLTEQLRSTDFDAGSLVKRMLRSNLFFSPLAYRTKIKSPVEFALNIVRGLEGRIGASALAQALDELGQSLFYPPSVKGWDGGEAWLNGQTLLLRQNLTLAFTSTEDARFGRRADPAELVRRHGKKADGESAELFLQLFLQGDVPPESRSKLFNYRADGDRRSIPAYWNQEDAADQHLRSLCRLVLTLPEFQLN
jgi:uncharacterized protein (DUF1800 family)